MSNFIGLIVRYIKYKCVVNASITKPYHTEYNFYRIYIDKISYYYIIMY